MTINFIQDSLRDHIVAIDSIRPARENARVHGEENLHDIKTSLATFGQDQLIVVNDETGEIVKGNGRWLAMKSLGWTECAVIRIPESRIAALARAIADNRSSDTSEFDEAILYAELKELQGTDWEEATGFDENEFAELALEYEDKTEEDEDAAEKMATEDVASELQKKWGTELGQIWQLGAHRIVCGDSTVPAVAAAVLDGQLADCMWTDPPYGVSYVGKTKDALVIENDGSEGLPELLTACFSVADRVLKNGAPIYVAHPGGPLQLVFNRCFVDTGWKFHETLVWIKDSMVLGHSDYHWKHEPIMYGWKGANRPWYAGRSEVSTIEVDRPKRSSEHPCLSPESLVFTSSGLQKISEVNEGDLVLGHDGVFHRVTGTTLHPYDEEIYRIRVRGTNITVDATHNHPFLVWRNSKTEFIEASELVIGDYIVSPIVTGETQSTYTADECFLIGLFAAEGSFLNAGHGRNKYPVFVLHKKETNLIQRIKDRFGEKVSVYPNGENGVTVVAFVPEWGEIFEWACGHGARSKNFCSELFSWDEKSRAAVLEGYLAGDGYVIRGHPSAKTVSVKLASQIFFLAESLGKRASFRGYAGKEGSGIGDRKFKNVARYYQIDITDRPQKTPDGKFILRRIASIDKIAYNGLVSNLEVEGCHTFQTAIGMSHNTMKPTALIEKLLVNSTKPGDLVYEPFSGSGSTLIACENLKRACRAIELAPKYVAVALERWSKHTGGVPEKVGQVDLSAVLPPAATEKWETLSFRLAAGQVEVVNQALSSIKAATGSDNTGRLLELLAAEYLAGVGHATE